MEKLYQVGEFAKMINKSVNTFQRWDREGTLTKKKDYCIG